MSAKSPSAAGDPCPRCQARLVSERQATAWCAACEWNLLAYEPARRRIEFGWRWVDRLTQRLAYRSSARHFAALSGKEVTRPGWGVSRLCLTAGGALFLAAITALLAGGLYLIVADWLHPAVVAGIVLVLLALALRPQLGKVDKAGSPLTRAQAPTLFDLVDRVAAALGAPVPQLVLTDGQFNAYSGVVGVRGRRVLSLGLPLWAVLRPQERVAVLAHELGHFVNGDTRSLLLTRIPLGTLNALSDIFRPPGRLRTAFHRFSFQAAVAYLLTLVLFTTVYRVLWFARLAMLWVVHRDGERAEYLADGLAARAAGSAGMAGALDALLMGEAITVPLLASARRGSGAAQWRAAAEAVRATDHPRLPRLRQLSIRDRASLFATHPPSGLRARMVETRPWTEPTVVLTETESARIDEELAKAYERVRRDLLHA